MKCRIDEVVNVAGLSADHQNQVLELARYMVTESGEKSIFKYLRDVPLGTDLSLAERESVCESIKKLELIDDLPVAAMLVTNFNGTYHQKNFHEQLKLYALLGAIRFPKRRSTITNTCRRIRMANKAKYRWLFSEVFSLDCNLKSIVLGLHTLEEKVAKDGRKGERCAELRRLLSDYYYDVDRESPGPTGPKATKLIEDKEVTRVDDFLTNGELEADLIRTVEPTSSSGAPASTLQSQQYVDIKTTPAREVKSSKSKQRRDARYAVDNMRMRAVHAPCLWSSLTDNEAQSALQACFDAVEASQSQAHAWIALSILLGRKPSELLELPTLTSHRTKGSSEYWYATKHKVQLVITLSMPRPKNHEFREFALQPINRLSLSIPGSLKPFIRSLTKIRVDERIRSTGLVDEICEAIANLNEQLYGRLTEHRLATYMHSTLVQAGVDEVVVKRLRGFTLKNNVSQHYDASLLSVSQDVFNDFVSQSLFSIGRGDDFSPDKYSDMPLGSNFVPRKEIVRRYFRCWRDHIQSISDKGWDPVEFHNEYALFVYSVLCLCTGHRPVRQCFGSILDYDPISREFLIRDKASRFDADTRCVVLPETSHQVLQLYTEHLESLQRRAWGRSSSAVRAARNALSGDGPLLFRIDTTNDEDHEIQSFDPGLVERWLDHRWPMTLNWSRHFLVTECRAQQMPFEAINAFVGHSDIGPAAFGHFGHLSYRQMALLAESLNEMLVDLEVVAIGGLR